MTIVTITLVALLNGQTAVTDGVAWYDTYNGSRTALATRASQTTEVSPGRHTFCASYKGAERCRTVDLYVGSSNPPLLINITP